MKEQISKALDTFREFSENNLSVMRSVSLTLLLGGVLTSLMVKKPFYLVRFTSISQVPERIWKNPNQKIKGLVSVISAEESLTCSFYHIPHWKVPYRRVFKPTTQTQDCLSLKLAGLAQVSEKGVSFFNKKTHRKVVSVNLVGKGDTCAEAVVWKRGLFMKTNINTLLVKKGYAKPAFLPQTTTTYPCQAVIEKLNSELQKASQKRGFFSKIFN